MQNLEMINKISQILNDIARRNVLYSDPKLRTYYSYDEVIKHLEAALNVINETSRNPRPDNIPLTMPWSEKFFDPDNEFNPYVFNGSMSIEDFERASEAYIDDLEEVEL
jgi:hypothetical protein